MSVVEVRHALGGVASRAQLVEKTSRAEVDAALASRAVVVIAHGRYALRAADEARRAAHRLTGVASHLSAALHWGWAVKTPPSAPHVTLSRSRKVTLAQRRGIEVHRAELTSDEIVDGFTSQDRTLVDCARSVEFDEALAVADSALREGFSHSRFVALARDLRGPGSQQVRRVADEARAEAANPFESVLRAIALDVPRLHVRLQAVVDERTNRGCWLCRPA
jgi:hypothetical protein